MTDHIPSNLTRSSFFHNVLLNALAHIFIIILSSYPIPSHIIMCTFSKPTRHGLFFLSPFRQCNIAKKFPPKKHHQTNLLVCLHVFLFFGYICTLPYHYRKLLPLLTHTFTSRPTRLGQSQNIQRNKCAFLLLQNRK